MGESLGAEARRVRMTCATLGTANDPCQVGAGGLTQVSAPLLYCRASEAFCVSQLWCFQNSADSLKMKTREDNRR